MRLWSIHPKYLDAQGLVTLWREALLAQKVLTGNTKGYHHHPQLIRFRESPDPLQAIGIYLHFIAEEADSRGYRFDRGKILKCPPRDFPKINVTKGQLEFEINHLMKKLLCRRPAECKKLKEQREISSHPLFEIVPGPIEPWEKI